MFKKIVFSSQFEFNADSIDAEQPKIWRQACKRWQKNQGWNGWAKHEKKFLMFENYENYSKCDI